MCPASSVARRQPKDHPQPESHLAMPRLASLPFRVFRAFRGFVFFLLPAIAVAADKPAAKITYDDHLMPLLREKCFGCHNPDKVSGGLNLTSYSALMQGGSSGEVIAPGDLD